MTDDVRPDTARHIAELAELGQAILDQARDWTRRVSETTGRFEEDLRGRHLDDEQFRRAEITSGLDALLRQRDRFTEITSPD